MGGSATEQLWAASEIAEALGWSKRKVQTALSKTLRNGHKSVSGNLAEAWTVRDFPAPLKAELERLRTVHFYRSIEDVLQNPHVPWQPPFPLGRVRDEDLKKAEQLREALSRALALPEETSVAERARLAASEYARVFGYALKDRQIRHLITRTLDRDRGSKQFGRLEIYLPENAKPKDAPKVAVAGATFPELNDALENLSSRVNPTPAEMAYFWKKVVQVFALRIAEGTDETKVKRQMREFLLTAAPFLAESEQALRKNLDRKLKRACEDGFEALEDRRLQSAGQRRRPDDWQENVMLLAKISRQRDGRISLAWRELYMGTGPTGERFSEAFRDYYKYDWRTAKSEVPKIVRQTVRPMMEATQALSRGIRAHKLSLPSIHRDWSDTAAGDFYTADDMTPNLYWFEWADEGECEFDGRRFNVGRGQWLLFTDERTDLPLSYVLMMQPSYTSWHILTASARTFMDPAVGLPFKGSKYEGNIWQARNIKAQHSWATIEEGFGRHKITMELKHATTPKAKVIERVFGSVQNMMEHLPGNVGRDEKKDRFERTQKFLQSIKRVGQPIKAEVDPRQMLLEREQLATQIDKVLAEFAQEPQNGERLDGLSPAEAWQQLSPRKPHQVLPDSLRYLLATAQSEQCVTSEGIKLRIGGRLFYYCGSERLGELIGEKVKVYYNPEIPEQITVVHPGSDPKGLQPFGVPLFERLPANSATHEDFAKARQHQRAFGQYGKALFRVLTPPRNLTLRDEQLGSAELRDRGAAIHSVEQEAVELRGERSRHSSEITELAKRQNLAIDPGKAKRPERVLQSLRRSQELEAEILRMEAEQKQENVE